MEPLDFTRWEACVDYVFEEIAANHHDMRQFDL
jgi:hypothetical protein